MRDRKYEELVPTPSGWSEIWPVLTLWGLIPLGYVGLGAAAVEVLRVGVPCLWRECGWQFAVYAGVCSVNVLCQCVSGLLALLIACRR